MASRSMTLAAGGGGGAALGVTVTVSDAIWEPPAPDAVIVYFVVWSGHTWREPLGPTLPIPGSIDAPVALVDDHSSMAHFPASTVAGFAESDTVGDAGAGFTCFACQHGIVL